ncbi:MAG: hypothetical protein HZB91_05235 [Elusimicrobia bacterium]|nr:hypothetical protein [Elusimicrobiota bacterium]
MNTHRLNITIPYDLARELDRQPNKSRFIAEAVEEKLAALKAKLVQAELAIAYSRSTEEDRDVTQDWDSTIADGL